LGGGGERFLLDWQAGKLVSMHLLFMSYYLPFSREEQPAQADMLSTVVKQ
jgi:hypothetical protein